MCLRVRELNQLGLVFEWRLVSERCELHEKSQRIDTNSLLSTKRDWRAYSPDGDGPMLWEVESSRRGFAKLNRPTCRLLLCFGARSESRIV